MIKKALLKFKTFELLSRGEIRQVTFSGGFKDPEFNSWKMPENDLIFIKEDGSETKLTYNYREAKFTGNHPEGGFIELYPPVNKRKEFALMAMEKEEIQEPEQEQKEITNFGVVSLTFLPNLDHVIHRGGRLRESFNKLFEKGYDFVVYSDNLTEDYIKHLVKNSKKDTVNFTDFQNTSFCISKEMWKNLGNKNSPYNLHYFIEKFLQEKEIDPYHVPSQESS